MKQRRLRFCCPSFHVGLEASSRSHYQNRCIEILRTNTRLDPPNTTRYQHQSRLFRSENTTPRSIDTSSVICLENQQLRRADDQQTSLDPRYTGYLPYLGALSASSPVRVGFLGSACDRMPAIFRSVSLPRSPTLFPFVFRPPFTSRATHNVTGGQLLHTGGHQATPFSLFP